MSWSVSRSWQADELVSTACNVGSDLFIANGLSITLLDEELNPRWTKSVPFRVHAAKNASGKIAILYGHGFHLIRVTDGQQIGEGDQL